MELERKLVNYIFRTRCDDLLLEAIDLAKYFS